MTDDTARRERAEKWTERFLVKMLAEGWEWKDESSPLSYGYLAGAREEATIKAAEIAALRERNETLADRLFDLGEMANPPCFNCGYNGSGYYSPTSHPCAVRHHATLKETNER